MRVLCLVWLTLLAATLRHPDELCGCVRTTIASRLYRREVSGVRHRLDRRALWLLGGSIIEKKIVAWLTVHVITSSGCALHPETHRGLFHTSKTEVTGA